MIDVERRELISYCLSKPKDTLGEISLHIENELWNTAVNRIYYAVSAMLLSIKVNAQTQSRGKANVLILFY
ncbi:MAG: hypothetical protein ACJA2S_003278 [Cyclobacteriaceae bacterium]|jgi:uncharacterized protein (UPF0332 family)